MFGGINFGDLVKKSPIRQIKILAKVSSYTVHFNGSCSGGLNVEIVTDYRLAITELDSSELNLAIVAQLHAGMNNAELLTNTRGSARPGICQRVTFPRCIQGKAFCREMFLFLHRTSKTTLYNLVKHLNTNGIYNAPYSWEQAAREQTLTCL